MNKTLKWVTLVMYLTCSFFLMSSTGQAAPATTTGTLTGKVTISGTKTAIPGATVKAVGSTGTFTAVANSTGTYTLTLLPATYTVTCSATGYITKTVSATIKAGVKTVLNIALTKATVTTGTLTGTVTNSTGTAIAGAGITTNTGGYTATTDSLGKYTITNMTAGAYSVTCTATGYTTQTKPATITANVTTNLNFTMLSAGVVINTLTATPSSFAEHAATTVTMTATITGTPLSYQWSQVAGPKVALTATSAIAASADVTTL
ncbi:MAG: carboxypeptidase regulatory-like domain-containing protein, partial [Desulfosalsimonadaceae bacterium]|nr:carboxypeptidase regulatory-like domain-containing protein [Desulfosalsimonadaceae bacterium]